MTKSSVQLFFPQGTVRQMVFRPVSGGNGEKSLTDTESSVKGTDTVGQQRVGDHHVRDTCIGQQLSTEINSEDHVESVMEGMRNIGISGVNGEIRGNKDVEVTAHSPIQISAGRESGQEEI